MLGRGLVKKAIAISVAVAAAFVAVLCLGAVLFFALSIVIVPMAAAAVTFLVFALAAVAVVMVFLKKADVDDEDDESSLTDGLAGRAFQLFRNRPILASVATLAGGFIFLRNPALATMVAADFTEKSRAPRR